jgi:hypothetical protein
VPDTLNGTVDKAVIKPHVFYAILHHAPKSAWQYLYLVADQHVGNSFKPE